MLLAGVLVCVVTMPWRLEADRGELVAWVATIAGLVLMICGALADREAEANPTGLLMAASGVGIFAEDLIKAWHPVVHTVGMVLNHVSTPLLIHTALAYPRGRLEGRFARSLVIAAYGAQLGFPFAMALVDGSSPIDRAANLLLVENDPALHGQLMRADLMSTVVLALLVVIATAHRARRATPSDRRLMGPLALGVLACAAIAVGHAFLRRGMGPPGPRHCFLHCVGGVRRRVLHVGAPEDRRPLDAGPVRSGPHQRSDATRDRNAHRTGSPRPQPSPRGVGRRFGPLPAPGRHPRPDPHPAVAIDQYRQVAVRRWETGWTDPLLVTSILTLVSAEFAARALAEGARAEVMRDLHDGAQQHLTALALRLRLLEDRADLSDTDRAAALLETRTGIEQTQSEIRRLARGDTPGPLQRGLAAAIRELAARTPLRVELDLAPTESIPADLARLAYFVVAEGLANALRHAHAGRVVVTCHHRGGRLIVSLRDDGGGGVRIDDHGGLAGLRSRLAAVDGHLVASSNAQGSLLRAILPCGETSCAW